MKDVLSIRSVISFLIATFACASCSMQKKIGRAANEEVLYSAALKNAEVGISVYEPATGKYWFNFQGDKYFVPASNTKIPTCYAAMKYLGDSLTGLRYAYDGKLLAIQATGDPSFLHPDYKQQPVADFLDKNFKDPATAIGYLYGNWNERQWGSGWSWNDYDETYMAERSPFPVYGNVITIKVKDQRNSNSRPPISTEEDLLFSTGSVYFDSLVKEGYRRYLKLEYMDSVPEFSISRSMTDNLFDLEKGSRVFTSQEIPFVTKEQETFKNIFQQKYQKKIATLYESPKNSYHVISPATGFEKVTIRKWNTIHSQPTDSLLRPMMHRSDNFFAEQSLLMVSNELLGVMNDQQIIDTLLKTDFSDLPQKPKWVDGSGLSRYNLFTPQDFVAIFDKMRKEFGMERIKKILPTGGTGTISSYYKAAQGFIFVKTGTLSGVVALSGFLLTKKNKQLIFSVLVNNHTSSATEVRKAIEKFIEGLRNDY